MSAPRPRGLPLACFRPCPACDGRGWFGVVGGPDLTYARGTCSTCNGGGWAWRSPTWGERARFALAALWYRLSARLAWIERKGTK